MEELLSGGLRERLAALEAWCTGAGKRCRINSASVLILFEGDAKAAEANGGRRPELKLIDFAHSFVEGATRPRRAARAATLSDPAKRGARAPFGLVRSCSAQFAQQRVRHCRCDHSGGPMSDLCRPLTLLADPLLFEFDSQRRPAVRHQLRCRDPGAALFPRSCGAATAARQAEPAAANITVRGGGGSGGGVAPFSAA